MKMLTTRYVALAILLLLQCGPALSAGSELEYSVKAALIFNFAKFIDWPPQAFRDGNSPIVVGIVGSDPFGPILDKTLEGKSAHGRTFVVRRLGDGNGLQACQMLFVSSELDGRAKRLIEEIRHKSVVTISDMPDFDKLGGMIRLFVSNDKVRFAINLAAVERANVRISSQLLKVGQATTTSGESR